MPVITTELVSTDPRLLEGGRCVNKRKDHSLHIPRTLKMKSQWTAVKQYSSLLMRWKRSPSRGRLHVKVEGDSPFIQTQPLASLPGRPGPTGRHSHQGRT